MDAAAQSKSAGLTPALREKLFALVGPNNFRPATPADQVSGVQPQFLLEPATESELAEVLRLSNEAGLAVIPRGGGTKLSWGNPPSRADLILSTTRLNKIIEHAWADLTVTVEAGCTIQRLQETLAEHGQRLALDPLWPEKATVGGILSINDSGTLRLRFGSLRDLIIGVTIALPDGTLASSGGKVVKNVAGYDLPKLVTGAFGTLGVITRAVFRLHPLPRNARSFSISTATPEDTQHLVLAIQDSKLAHTALQSRFSNKTQPVSDILFEGTEAGLAAQESQLRTLAAPAIITLAPASTWGAREALWSSSDPIAPASLPSTSTRPVPSASLAAPFAIAKISILPASMARTIDLLSQAAGENRLCWKALLHATGIAWLRLEGQTEALRATLEVLREQLERREGSLVVLHCPSEMPLFDAWGTPGDSLALMKSLKHQLDPASTLNPGRFLAGI
ncbi:MAG TPA: FAD-binding oxidoreductase [Candidatus Acidoferrum sp.]|nr:FAD-binding oxidoreductase [Candidatus Acidoferrum sp.]